MGGMGGLLFIVFFLNVTTDQFEKALTFLPPAVMNRQFIRLSIIRVPLRDAGHDPGPPFIYMEGHPHSPIPRRNEP